MRDLTQGSITKHLIYMALPIGFGMLVQTLYFIVDLYFVSRLGDSVIAGVSAGGNLMFLVMAMTQVINVGAVSLISQAVGRRDHQAADLIFNQTFGLGILLFLGMTLANLLGLTDKYVSTLGADAATITAGMQYLTWFVPGISLQFIFVALAASLRGTGVVKPTMIVQFITVMTNIVLTPVLVAGWGTGKPLGALGAGLSSFISILLGVGLLTFYFLKLEKYIGFKPRLWKPRWQLLKRLLAIGLPSGGEFALLFVYLGVVYVLIRHFGSEAQAGFGIGMRIMQSIFLPAMAIAFATPAIVGQNYGAKEPGRVRETFKTAAWISVAIMAVLTIVCQIRPEWFVSPFSKDAKVVTIAAEYLQIISWNFIATGLIFTSAGMFQGMGNTVPPLIATASRLVTFVIPAIFLIGQPGVELKHLWMLSVATVAFQALLNLFLLRGELNRKLSAFS